MGYVVNTQAEIIRKLWIKSSLRFKLNFIFLEHTNFCNFVLQMAHISAAARANELTTMAY